TLPMRHPDEVYDVRIDVPSNRLLTVCRDGGARLWDLSTGEILGPPVYFGTWLHYGKFISSNMIEVWDDGRAGAWVGRWSFMPDLPFSTEKVEQAYLLSGNGGEVQASGKSARIPDYAMPADGRRTGAYLKSWHVAQLRELKKERDLYAWEYHARWVKKRETEENR
ncbi:MAG: hypothetical protein JWN25_3086, partial [Verrucomicrobiales bacterium]|nr:hypothetical protein [Verrucomicrobiales bacterium]